MISAVLLDLDGTLVAQESAFHRAYQAVGQLAAERLASDQQHFADRVPEVAARLAQETPFAECLSRCRFGGRDVLGADAASGDGCEGTIADGTDAYRHQVWSSLAGDSPLANELSQAFRAAMRQSLTVFDEVEDCLKRLVDRYRLVVVTNGMERAQTDKLRLLGIDSYFDDVIASARVGAGKPSRRIFEEALRRLGVPAHQVVMVGDRLDGDIDGAKGAGIPAVWINRGAEPPSATVTPDAELTDLSGLLEAIEGLD